MESGPKKTTNFPPIKINEVQSFEIHDDHCVKAFNEYIDELISNLDDHLAQILAQDLLRLKLEHQQITDPAKKTAWFKKTFSFLHNEMGQLSPRLFVYFQQHECLYRSSCIYWFDQLSPRSQDIVGEKLVELLNKADTPRRQDFFLMLPRHIMVQGAHIELNTMIPQTSSSSSSHSTNKSPKK